MTRGVIALLAVASCHVSGSSSGQPARLDALAFDAPADWHRSDTAGRGVSTSVWTPASNDRKESVTIISSRLHPELAKAGETTLVRLLGAAEARPGGARAFTSRYGLHGARVDVDYVPPGAHKTYHRVHVALVDGDHLINLLYTALDPDVDLDAFNLVLGTIHAEG